MCSFLLFLISLIWHQNNSGFMEWILKYYLFLSLWNKLYSTGIVFFFLNSCLIKFTSEIIWTWSFLFWTVFLYKFNVFNICKTSWVIYLSWANFGSLCLSELIHFIYVVKFFGINLFITLLYYPSVSGESVLKSSLSFLIFVICIFLFSPYQSC